MKTYIGDGVYVDISQLGIVLTTENGIRATNTIVLEPEVLHALLEYLYTHTGVSFPKRIVK